MLISEVILDKVGQGQRFYVNLETRSMKVGKKWIMKNGIISSEFQLDDVGSDPIAEIEEAYEEFYYSMPSQRSCKNIGSYFKAMQYEDMTDYQLISGKPRELSRAMLEYAILLRVMKGVLKWKEEYGSWYWRSKKFGTFVILRKWIEKEA